MSGGAATLERVTQTDVSNYAGRWVAVKEGEVLHSAASPEAVLDWVEREGVEGVAVFRVRRKDEPSNWVY